MRGKSKRLFFVFMAAGMLAIAAGLMVMAFDEGMVFFHSPTDVLAKKPPADKRIRLGGLVEEGSLDRSGGSVVKFNVTDMNKSIPVSYKGLLPDLFREGQGVVAEGHVKGTVFIADEVLAKHDENYMPPEVSDALKQSGHWEEMQESMQGEQATKESGRK
jgi:cytochrome c-type biogenesis protein CcmE